MTIEEIQVFVGHLSLPRLGTFKLATALHTFFVQTGGFLNKSDQKILLDLAVIRRDNQPLVVDMAAIDSPALRSIMGNRANFPELRHVNVVGIIQDMASASPVPFLVPFLIPPFIDALVADCCSFPVSQTPFRILADALEDSGYANPVTLSHLRQDNHTIACWVIDHLRGEPVPAKK